MRRVRSVLPIHPHGIPALERRPGVLRHDGDATQRREAGRRGSGGQLDDLDDSRHGANDDTEWNTYVTVRITADPRLSPEQREVVETDYGMREGALDEYAFLRDIYLQRRDYLIRDGVTPPLQKDEAADRPKTLLELEEEEFGDDPILDDF